VELNVASQPGTLLQDLTDFENVMPGVGSGARILLDTRALLSVGEDVIAFADAFAARIGLVQLGDQSAGKPVSLGRGELPLSPLIERLKKADYNGHLVIDEPPPVQGKDTAAARAAKELVQTML
jgi:sugar phosphate isomerase/epimerase